MSISKLTVKILQCALECKQRGANYFEYIQACRMTDTDPIDPVSYNDDIIYIQTALTSYQLMHSTIAKAQQSSKLST